MSSFIRDFSVRHSSITVRALHFFVVVITVTLRLSAIAGAADLQHGIFPRTIPASADFRYDFENLTGPGVYQLTSGPMGLKMDRAGLVEWYAGSGLRGTNSMKFDVINEGQTQSWDYALLVQYGTAMPVVGASVPEAIPPIEFKRLALANPVKTMELTEDGKYLLLAHDSENTLGIVDVKSGELVNEVETPRPVSIICRRGKAYVANYGAGTISVHDSEELFERTDQVTVGPMNIIRLSAAKGKYFRNHIVAICNEGRNDMQVGLVDIGKKRSTRLPAGYRTTAATVDYRGEFLMIQGGGGSPSRAAETIYDYKAALAGRKVTPFQRGYDSLPILYQSRPTAFWFGGNEICRGLPPKRMGEGRGEMVIGDREVDLCYEIHQTGIRCVKLDGSLSVIGERRIVVPEEFTRLQYGSDGMNRLESGAQDYQQIAESREGYLRIFLLDSPKGDVYYAESSDFSKTDWRVGPENVAGRDGEMGLIDFRNQLTEIKAGETLELELPQKDDVQYNLVSGPAGLDVSLDGKVTWTTTAKDVGEHSLKIRRKQGDGITFLTYEAQVVSEEQAAPHRAVMRKWSDASGSFSVTAQFVELDGENVVLKTLDSRTLNVLLSRLSDADRLFVKQWNKQ